MYNLSFYNSSRRRRGKIKIRILKNKDSLHWQNVRNGRKIPKIKTWGGKIHGKSRKKASHS